MYMDILRTCDRSEPLQERVAVAILLVFYLFLDCELSLTWKQLYIRLRSTLLATTKYEWTRRFVKKQYGRPLT